MSASNDLTVFSLCSIDTRLISYLYLRELTKNNFNITFVHVNLYRQPTNTSNLIHGIIRNKTLHSIEELGQFLNTKTEKSIFNVQIHPSFKNRKIINLLSKGKQLTIFYAFGLYPGVTESFLSDRFSFRLKNYCKKLIFALMNYKKIEHDILFYTGAKAKMLHSMCKTKVSLIDNEILQLDQKSSLSNIKTAVYIDQGFGFHPDEKILGYGCKIPNLFYSKLEKYLGNLSEAYKYEVIVALHPKRQKNNFSCNAKFKLTENVKLAVSQCNIVLAHCSTAIGLAVFLKKPIVLLTDSILFKKSIQNRIAQYHTELGCSLVDLNKNSYQLENLVNQEKYKKFIYNYLAESDYFGQKNFKKVYKHLTAKINEKRFQTVRK